MKKITMKNSLLIALASTIFVSSCASVTSPEASGAIAKASLPDSGDSWSGIVDQLGDVEIGWLAKLEDPILNGLVQEAIDKNRNLQAAAAGVERSWALAGQVGAGLLPSLNVTGNAGASGSFEERGNEAYSTQLQAKWELDLWGRVKAGVDAAQLGAQAVEADYKYAQYSMAAAVARAYFLTIEADQQAKVAQKTLDALTEIDRIVGVQYEAGVASAQDLALSKSDLASTQASLIAAQGAQRNAMRALEVLLGRYPSAQLDIPVSLPTIPDMPPAGTPSQLLERRPDIVAAERNVASKFRSLDQAKVANLPSISLTGSLGGASTQLSDLLNPANLAWQAGTSLAAPLFDGGQNEASLVQANAEQKQALALYGQTALDAFKEVETGLDQSDVLKRRAAALDLSAEKANEALRIANLQYNEGETSLIDVLSIQQRVFQADSKLVSVQQSMLSEWVNLNLALGGSW